MFDLGRDLKHTFRRLARTPGFALATVLTLALGIGANTAIFSVVHTVLLKPLPFPEPDRLIAVWQTAPGVEIKDLNASMADYVTYREESKTFEDVALWAPNSVTVTEFSDPERVDCLYATFRLLPLLGFQPMLGRPFAEGDNTSQSPEVVMLSHGYWQRHFGADPNVIGRRILVDGKAREVIGVAPRNFWFMDAGHDVILPLRYDRATVRLAGYNYRAIVRLRPGVTLEQANADVARMIGIALDKIPPPTEISIQMMREIGLAPNARPLMNDLLGDIGSRLWVVMATIGVVLLIACANVANLLLVRAEGRTQELAVRAALGAGRGRLARELLVESVSLALLGGAVGIAFALGIVQLVLAMSPVRLPRLEGISLDPITLLFTLGVSLLAGLAFGSIPVLKYAGRGLAESLRAGGRTASAGRNRNLTRNGLTAVQVALALVLLIGSGLMIRTFHSMRLVDPGFRNPESLQTLQVSVPSTVAPKEADLLRLQQNLVERLATVPGAQEASLIVRLPMSGDDSQDPVSARDRTYAPGQIPPLRRFILAMPGTFHTLGTTLLAGREYTWTDIHEIRNVVIISDNFAKEYWGSAQAAVGKQIRSAPSNPWSEVIGVVADVRVDGVDQKAPSIVYWPARRPYTSTFLVRSPLAGTEQFVSALRAAIWEVNAGLPINKTRTMKEVYDKSMARTAFTLVLLGISGAMALILAAVGIHAAISYTVSQRKREIGIRLALGAPRGHVKRIFVRNGLTWAAIGAIVGLAASFALTRLMTSLLFEVSPLDPITYIVVVVGILSAAAAASYLPARRVAQVDPVEALRAE